MKTWARICFAAALLAVLAAGYFYSQEAAYLRRAKTADAVVTANVKRSYTGQDSNQTYQYYCPTLQFQTAAGQSVKYDPDMLCSALDQPPTHQVGDKVTLYYDPLDPNAIQLPDFMGQYIAVVFYAALAVILALIGLLLQRLSQRTAKQAAADELLPWAKDRRRSR